MANEAEFEQDRTAWLHSHGYRTHDALEAAIRASDPGLENVSGLSAHIDRYFKKHGNRGDFADVLAFVRHDVGLA